LLNYLKNRIRFVTAHAVDVLPIKRYPNTLEAKQVKHEVDVLLCELQARGLLPENVHIDASIATGGSHDTSAHTGQI
jgi:hypothetical protein